MKSNNNISMAMSSIGSAKWRSFLTMLGVIIGVTSVITIVSLGEGIKRQLTGEIVRSGSDLITVRGGHVADFDKNGTVTDVNLLRLFAGGTLSDADFQTVQKVEGLQLASPFAVVTGVPRLSNGAEDTNANIIATNEKGAQALNQEIAYGDFWGEKDNNAAFAVIGKGIAEDLFKENVPVGKTFELRGRQFTVRGIFRPFEASPLSPGVDYNNTIFIPYELSKQLTTSQPQPYQVLARPQPSTSPNELADKIHDALKTAHGGQTDFTVLKAGDLVAVATSVLNMMTNFVSAIAAVSLLVGGIGIMNIMLVAVSERTHEIGVRKSVGATNRQIMNQFLVEAVVISGTGGVLGVLASLIVNYLFRVLSNMQPVITLPVMGMAVLVALGVGVFFGLTPALKAARKDPIEALRRT